MVSRSPEILDVSALALSEVDDGVATIGRNIGVDAELGPVTAKYVGNVMKLGLFIAVVAVDEEDGVGSLARTHAPLPCR